MIDLHYWPTPNGKKVTILLEELGLPYKIVPVHIGRGDQFTDGFLQISPNNRMPALVDHEPADGGAPLSVFESGAIMIYLAEKTGRFLPADVRGKYEVIMNKDISVAAQVFQRFRRFSQGEVHSLFWDGVGMNLAWKTRRIKGTVVDLALEDLQNTGKKQLVVCLNTYSGAVGIGAEKTVIVTYDLDVAPQK